MLGKLAQAADDPYTAGHFRKALLKTPREVETPPEFGPVHILKPGNAQGLPLPGNLAVAATLAGTGFLPDPAGKILFFEDLNEPVYKLDRYLTQLEQAGFLRNLEGIADAHIIGGKAHDAAEERPVGSVSVIGFCEGTIKCKICPDDLPANHFLSQKTDAGRACRVGTGRADHIRSEHIENTDK